MSLVFSLKKHNLNISANVAILVKVVPLRRQGHQKVCSSHPFDHWLAVPEVGVAIYALKCNKQMRTLGRFIFFSYACTTRGTSFKKFY